MKVKAILPKAKKQSALLPQVQAELNEVQKYLDGGHMPFPSDAIGFGVLQGNYRHDIRSMDTICLIANGYDYPVEGIAGSVALTTPDRDAFIARLQFTFNEDFLGKVNPGEAILVHFNIPVKGLKEDCIIQTKEFRADINDFRYVPSGQENNE